MGNTHSHTHAELTHRLTEIWRTDDFWNRPPFATHGKVSQTPISLLVQGLYSSSVNFKFHNTKSGLKVSELLKLCIVANEARKITLSCVCHCRNSVSAL